MAELEHPQRDEIPEPSDPKIDSELLKGLRGYEYRNNDESITVNLDFNDPLQIPRTNLGRVIAELTGIDEADILSWRVRQVEVELKPNQIRTFANSDSIMRISQNKPPVDSE